MQGIRVRERRRAGCRLAAFCLAAMLAGCLASPVSAQPPAATGDRFIFTADQSTGGKVVDLAGGTKGVTLDRSCERKWPEVTRIEWKSAAPMPAGWYHGVLDLGVRTAEDLGWVQVTVGVNLVTPGNPLVSLMDNFSLGKYQEQQYSFKGPIQFEFWIYSATPATGVEIRPVYSDIWKYKRPWPITQVTMERVESPALDEDTPVTLALAVREDGTAVLPADLPAGLWSLAAGMKTPGSMLWENADGRRIEAPFSFDVWHRPGPIRVYSQSPLRKLSFQTKSLFKSVVLTHTRRRAAASIATDGQLMPPVDAARSESAELQLVGKDLTGEAPSLPVFPMGRKIAVLTSWDDGPQDDLRLAEILKRLGYHPSFFINQNNPAMKFLDKLEALGAEVGSHCYTHTFLFNIPPQRAVEECVEMRKLLEKELKHPVISFAYPNGYTAAYDVQGDYVLRAMRAAGYWSGRTTATPSEPADAITEPLALKTNGFFGDRAGLQRAWEQTRGKEGGIFYIWGHAWQIGKTDEQWNDLEKFMAGFANQPDAWYASQGELFTWLWMRKNTQLTVAGKSPAKVTVKLTRPWLHPYLAGKRPLSLKVPAGVEKVVWQGKEFPVTNGFVELPWLAAN